MGLPPESICGFRTSGTFVPCSAGSSVIPAQMVHYPLLKNRSMTAMSALHQCHPLSGVRTPAAPWILITAVGRSGGPRICCVERLEVPARLPLSVRFNCCHHPTWRNHPHYQYLRVTVRKYFSDPRAATERPHPYQTSAQFRRGDSVNRLTCRQQWRHNTGTHHVDDCGCFRCALVAANVVNNHEIIRVKRRSLGRFARRVRISEEEFA